MVSPSSHQPVYDQPRAFALWQARSSRMASLHVIACALWQASSSRMASLRVIDRTYCDRVSGQANTRIQHTRTQHTHTHTHTNTCARRGSMAPYPSPHLPQHANPAAQLPHALSSSSNRMAPSSSSSAMAAAAGGAAQAARPPTLASLVRQGIVHSCSQVCVCARVCVCVCIC